MRSSHVIVLGIILLALLFVRGRLEGGETREQLDVDHWGIPRGEPAYLRPPSVPLTVVLPVADAEAASQAVREVQVGTEGSQGKNMEAVDRLVEARLTYYTDRGVMYTGYRSVGGAVAVDPRVIPHGTILRIVGDNRLRVALDTGGMVIGAHVDAWVASEEEGQALINRLVAEGWARTEGDQVFVQIAEVQKP